MNPVRARLRCGEGHREPFGISRRQDFASHGLPIQHAARVNELLADHLQSAEIARLRA
jgi:hypothetical protein